MRILYVMNYYKPAWVYGGPARSASTLCEAMAAAGATVTVLTTNANGPSRLDVPLRTPVTLDGVTVHYYPVMPVPPRSFFYSPELARALGDQAARHDLLVLDTLWTHAMLPAVRAATRVRRPYVVSLRGALLPQALAHHAWRKRLFFALGGRAALDGAAALSCTDEVEARAVAALGLRAPAFVVPNPVDDAVLAPLPVRGALRARLGIPSDAPLVLFLGRLHALKRPELALAALAAAAVPHAHLVLAGPDEQGLAGVLRQQAAALGLLGRVHVLEALDPAEVRQALADANLLLMPSLTENFGMAAAEALAAGVPVLTTPVVPVGQLAATAGAGRVAEPDALGPVLRELLADHGRLAEMGRCGRRLVEARFSPGAVAAAMLTRFEQIVLHT